MLYQIPSLHLQDLLHRSTTNFHCIVRGRGGRGTGVVGGWAGGPTGGAGGRVRPGEVEARGVRGHVTSAGIRPASQELETTTRSYDQEPP